MSATQGPAGVVGNEPVGAYRLLTLAAPHVAAGAEPGQFVAVAVGGPGTAMLLRRAFALYTAAPSTGLVQLVVAEHGPGTAWLVRVPVGTQLDVIGPLGRPFPPAAPGPAVLVAGGSAHEPFGHEGGLVPPGPAVLVAGGYGSAPMFDLARRLRAEGGSVHLVLGAATADRLFGVGEAGAVADSVTVTTDDGSAGRRGLVTDGLAALVERTRAGVVYACGPMAMLAAVGDIAAAYAVPCHVAVEEAMACGIGVCMTCVLPVVGDDGRSRMLRSCTDGPVFEASRVRWKDVGTLPGDLHGADAMSGH